MKLKILSLILVLLISGCQQFGPDSMTISVGQTENDVIETSHGVSLGFTWNLK